MARNAKNTRMCSGCMIRRDKGELVCVYKSETGICIGNPQNKKSGRSLYICPDEKCMEKSIKRKCFSRSLKLEIPPEFYSELRAYFALLNKE